MLPGGKTIPSDIAVGRRILCKEDPKTKAKSKCANELAKTVNIAKKGLNSEQLKLWGQMVYTPAVLMLARHCVLRRPVYKCNPWSGDPCRGPVPYPVCAEDVFVGTFKFQGPFGKQYKWSDYLIKGAKTVKLIKTKPAAKTAAKPVTRQPKANTGGFSTQPND